MSTEVEVAGETDIDYYYGGYFGGNEDEEHELVLAGGNRGYESFLGGLDVTNESDNESDDENAHLIDHRHGKGKKDSKPSKGERRGFTYPEPHSSLTAAEQSEFSPNPDLIADDPDMKDEFDAEDHGAENEEINKFIDKKDDKKTKHIEKDDDEENDKDSVASKEDIVVKPDDGEEKEYDEFLKEISKEAAITRAERERNDVTEAAIIANTLDDQEIADKIINDEDATASSKSTEHVKDISIVDADADTNTDIDSSVNLEEFKNKCCDTCKENLQKSKSRNADIIHEICCDDCKKKFKKHTNKRKKSKHNIYHADPDIVDDVENEFLIDKGEDENKPVTEKIQAGSLKFAGREDNIDNEADEVNNIYGNDDGVSGDVDEESEFLQSTNVEENVEDEENEFTVKTPEQTKKKLATEEPVVPREEDIDDANPDLADDELTDKPPITFSTSEETTSAESKNIFGGALISYLGDLL
jgi:hypothetical protein